MGPNMVPKKQPDLRNLRREPANVRMGPSKPGPKQVA